MSEEQIVAKLSAMSKANFVKDIRAAYAEGSEDLNIQPWLLTLGERRNDFSDAEVIDQIVTVENGDALRALWISICQVRHNEHKFNDSRLLQMLSADDTSDDLKDYKNQSDGSIKGAILVISNKLEKGKIRTNSAEKADLLSVCNTILVASDNADLKDSIVGSLMLIGDYDALQMIVHNLGVDNIMRSGIIDGNYYVLEQVLQARPAKEDVIFAVQCMGILPIKDLYEPLKTAIAALPAAFSADESREFAGVLQKMLDEGVPAKTELKK